MLAFVGSRTTRERQARGVGLSVYEVDAGMSRWSLLQTIDLINPSYLLVEPTKRRLYAVHGDLSDASSFQIESDGRLELLNQRLTRGRNPVHLALSKEGRFLVIANYATGSLSALPVLTDGSLGDATSTLLLHGTPGPKRGDQKGSHPHQVLRWPDSDLFIVPDKGIDRVHLVSLDENGILSLSSQLTAAPGAGPRHAALDASRNLAWVGNELDSTVTTCRVDPYRPALHPLGTTSLLAPDFKGSNTAAGIASGDDALYVSNRGLDGIVTMSVDPRSGELSRQQFTSTAGTIPRFITLTPDRRHLLAANEGSDTIVRHRIGSDGLLDGAEIVATTGSPVCIAFLP